MKLNYCDECGEYSERRNSEETACRCGKAFKVVDSQIQQLTLLHAIWKQLEEIRRDTPVRG